MSFKPVTSAYAFFVLVTLTYAANIVTVPVGNPGNPGDMRFVFGGAGSYGSVDYAYNIGKYEVTAGQYTEFLNAVGGVDTYGLYNTVMANPTYGCWISRSGSVQSSYTYSVALGYENRPVDYVSFWDACRFANWLSNGKPSGTQSAKTTETGTYTLNGYNGADGREIQRNSDWKWAVASGDEWYKSAYYNPATSSYYNYPTSSNTIDPSMANYGNILGYMADAGSHSWPSPYGTFDQGGNVWEITEALMYQDGSSASRRVRGGSSVSDSSYLLVSYPNSAPPHYEATGIGFRISYIPEPATIVILASAGLIAVRKKR